MALGVMRLQARSRSQLLQSKARKELKQGRLRTIEQNDLEARNILSRSEGNGSQVAQLQSALQMLALIHQNLVSITQNIATAGRVTSNIVARHVTERRIDRERQLRFMRDYNQRSSSPPIDSRFLQEGSW